MITEICKEPSSVKRMKIIKQFIRISSKSRYSLKERYSIIIWIVVYFVILNTKAINTTELLSNDQQAW